MMEMLKLLYQTPTLGNCTGETASERLPSVGIMGDELKVPLKYLAHPSIMLSRDVRVSYIMPREVPVSSIANISILGLAYAHL